MKPDHSHHWMPDLCRPRALFGVMVAVELVVLSAVLFHLPQEANSWKLLSIASLLAQWLALMCVTVLCQLRPLIARVPRSPGIVLALALTVTIVGLATWLVTSMDQALDLGFSVAPEQTLRFVLTCMLVSLLLTAAVLRYFYVAEQWRRQVAASAQAQVEALQARIRPHFLFNSMNTIAGLIRHDPRAAETAVEDLSELFRAALGAGKSESTLEEELHLTRRYLAIEALRLGDRLEIDWSIDTDLPQDLAMPYLILQPLVENAITHGIARLSQGGQLHIAVRRKARGVEIEVRNPVPPAGTRSHGNQHAQDSISQRLRHRFGDTAGLVAGARDGYYAAMLFIPFDPP